MTKIGNRITRTTKEDNNRDWTLIYYAFDVASYLEQYKHAGADKVYYARLVQNAIESIRYESESGAKALEKYVRGLVNVNPDLKGLLDELAD